MRPSLYLFIRSLIPGGPVYLKIRRDRLDLIDSATQNHFSTSPVLLIPKSNPNKGAVLESLADVTQYSVDDIQRENGFDHPRTILSDFIVAEKTLQLALRELFKDQTLRPSPILVVHPLEKLDGGLTTIERRAIRELGEGAGARNVYIWEGRELSAAELSSDRFADELAHMEA